MFSFIIALILFPALIFTQLTARTVVPPTPITITPEISQQSIVYKTYSNEKYGFGLQYPSNWIMQDQSTLNDGRSFNSPDNKCQLTAYGASNVLDYEKNIDSYLKEVQKTNTIEIRKRDKIDGFNAVSYSQLSKSTNQVSYYIYITGKEQHRGISLTCDDAATINKLDNYNIFQNAANTFNVGDDLNKSKYY